MSSKYDKSKMPSRHITEGPKSAAHRAFFYAMGVSHEAMSKPIVGVAATTWNETAPGPAYTGAVTHPGASEEKSCYTDI